jgi:hypothetical protein
MSDMHATASLHVEVIPAAREQAPILANLVELYAHDFSEFHAVALGDDGRFGYPSLPLYWSESGRYPFLLRIDGGWGGFVLVKQGSDVTGNRLAWDMAEFFVVRGCRRRSAGTQVAHEIWRRFPGTGSSRHAGERCGAALLGSRYLDLRRCGNSSRFLRERRRVVEPLLVRIQTRGVRPKSPSGGRLQKE